MQTVRGNDDVGFDVGSIGEGEPGRGAVLLEAGAAVSGVDDLRRQRAGQHVDEVGAVHAEGCVPARGVGDLNRRDGTAVLPEILRSGPNPRAPFFHRRSQADALQLPRAIGRDEDAGADLAKRRRLLIDRDLEAVCDQRVRGEQAADAAADNRDTWFRHGHARVLFR